jgi:hypothetical protein
MECMVKHILLRQDEKLVKPIKAKNKMDKLLFHKILNIVSGVTICILCIFLCLRSCTSPDVTQAPLVHTDTIVVV